MVASTWPGYLGNDDVENAVDFAGMAEVFRSQGKISLNELTLTAKSKLVL